MPIFEYKCNDCGTVSSILVKSGSGRGVKCPKCGSKSMAKQISSFSAVVKDSSGSDGSCQSCCQLGQCPNMNM